MWVIIMITGIIPEKSPDNETMLITTTISTHDISPMNALVTQQEKVHSQAPAQEDERKEKMSTRIIDDTTHRIYFPRTLEVTAATIPEAFAATTHSVSASLYHYQ